MARIVQTRNTNTDIRVALVIEAGKLKPVWFEPTGKTSADRIFIKEVCAIWMHHHGSAKIISFAVSDESNSYVLALDTTAFTWELGVVEEEPFPSSSSVNWDL